MANLKYDLTDKTFGDWTVLAKAGSSKGPTKWKCQCVCGTIRYITSYNLRKERTLGCGCKKGDRITKKKTRHGQSNTKLYQVWASIKQRCGNQPGYESVSMCRRWRESFEKFAEDVGQPPTDKHSIDRVDGSGDYEPGNVRWATPKEQNRNRSNTLFLTYRGERKPLREWAEILEVPAMTLHARIKRYGMTVEEAFNTPIRTQKNNATKQRGTQ